MHRKPVEFRKRAVKLAREGSRWMAQADIDAGRKNGLSSSERKELACPAQGEPGVGDGERDEDP